MLPGDDEDFSTIDTPPDDVPEPPIRAPSPPLAKPKLAKPRVAAVSPSPILSAEPVAEICWPLKLSERARQLLQGIRAPLQFLDALLHQELFEDATRFLAHALLRREAVGWAYLCARQAHAVPRPPQAEVALQAAADWIVCPDEAHRHAAWKAAAKAGLGTPAGKVSAAAFLSGPDPGPPAPLVKPAKNYTAVCVTGVVLCAANWGDPEEKTARYRRYFEEGRNVAGGARPWENRQG